MLLDCCKNPNIINNKCTNCGSEIMTRAEAVHLLFKNNPPTKQPAPDGVEEARKWLRERVHDAGGMETLVIPGDRIGPFTNSDVERIGLVLAAHARPYIEQRDAARKRAACLYRILAEGFRVDMNKPAQYENGWNDSTRAMHKAVTEELGEMEDSYEELLADSVKLEAAEAELKKLKKV